MKLGKQLQEVLVRSQITTAHSLTDYYPSLIEKGVSNWFESIEIDLNQFFEGLVEPILKAKGIDPNFQKAVFNLTQPTKQIHSLLLAFAAPQLLAGLLTFLLFPVIRSGVHLLNKAFPSAYPDIAYVLNLRRRGLIQDDTFYDMMRAQGIRPLFADLLAKGEENFLAVSSLIDAINRGMIAFNFQGRPRGDIITGLKLFPEEEDFSFAGQLRRLGYGNKSILALDALRYVVPTPSDVVRFAVREVFSPEVAERFGQFEDFPEKAIPWAEASGISPEVLKMYWAAHWNLPSATMGFEMLHRGIINQDELKLLLKALDVMPFWRDKLIKLSFRPLTRVDIRRMHKLGVLKTDAELIKAYKDIGYNEENAKRLAIFTKTLTAKEQQDLLAREILEMYSLGMLSKEEAISKLKDIGVEEKIAQLKVGIISFRMSKARQSAVIRVILNNFARGTINKGEALNLLRQNKVDVNTISPQLDVIDFARQNLKAKPSRTDLRRYFLSGIINEDTYRKELVSLGIRGEFLEWEVEFAKKTLERAQATTGRKEKQKRGGQ